MDPLRRPARLLPLPPDLRSPPGARARSPRPVERGTGALGHLGASAPDGDDAPWRPGTLTDIAAVAPLQKLSYKYGTVPDGSVLGHLIGPYV
ncbi:hypothetical protein IOD13_14860 [Brevibacterium casei]|nr:hypothetical protein [Brevibacterium casei]